MVTKKFGLWWSLASQWFNTRFEGLQTAISQIHVDIPEDLARKGDIPTDYATKQDVEDAVKDIDTSDLAKQETLSGVRTLTSALVNKLHTVGDCNRIYVRLNIFEEGEVIYELADSGDFHDGTWICAYCSEKEIGSYPNVIYTDAPMYVDAGSSVFSSKERTQEIGVVLKAETIEFATKGEYDAKLSELSTKVGEIEGVIGTPKEGAEYTTIFGAIEQLIGSLQDDWRATDAEAEAYFNS